MPNYELGFGSPFYTNQPNGDMGFGAPYTISVGATSYSTLAEQGFGDKLEVVVSFIGGDQVEYGDEGGVILRLKGDWRGLFSVNQLHAGPFMIKMVKDDIKTTCQSGLPGFPTQTWANNLGNEIQTILPSGLDHGIYDIEISYGPEFGQTITILSAVEIAKGLRDYNVANLKFNIPQFYDVGIRSDYGHKIETTYNNEKSNLAQILTAIGEEISTLIEGKYTILSEEAVYGDTELVVESTHTYPTIGLIKVGQQEFIYTSKTATTFVLQEIVQQKIPKFTPVNLLDDKLSKIDNYYLRQVYRYQKPSSFTIKNQIWDETFRFLQFADRHVMPTVYNYFSKLTSQYDWSHQCVLSDANEQIFIILDPNYEFNLSHVDRFVEINNVVYYSDGLIDDVPHISDAEILVKGLKLIKLDTSLFRGANFNDFSEIHQLNVKPFNIYSDYNGKFEVEYEASIFPSANGFIDLNYIDVEEFGIYFDNKDSIGEQNFIDFFVAGIQGIITRRRKVADNFGTYITVSDDPDFVGLEPDNEIQ